MKTKRQKNKPMLAGIFSFIILFLVIIPLNAQTFDQGNEYDEDAFWDDEFLFMEGEGITIVGSISTTQQTETIDRETIEKINAADLPSLLAESLNIAVTRYGPYGNESNVNLRGFNTRRIAVLIDGVPVNSTATGNFDFNSIDLGSIERVEVIFGGSDTKFNVSGAMGGVINIVTVKKQEPGWSAGGSVSNTSYLPGKYKNEYEETQSAEWQDILDTQALNLFAAFGAENFSFRANIFGNRAGNHFLYSDYKKSTKRKTGNEILDAGASASMVWELPDHSIFIAAGSFYMGDKNIPTGGYSIRYAEQRETASRENLMLEMPRAFHDDFSMELSLGHNWRNTFYDPGISPSSHNEHLIDVINRWGWYPAPAFTLRFGGDYRFIYLNSTNTEINYGHRGGLYITSEFYPEKKLLLISSIKMMTDSTNIIPVPKIGFSWMLNDSLTLRNNYFRNFKFPDFDDLYWVQSGYTGNPDLKSEDGWGADLGIYYSHNNILNLDSTIYGQWINDSIHWTYASNTWKPRNSGTAAYIGLDTNLKFTLPFAPFFFDNPVLGMSWVFQLSWLLSGDLKFSDNRRIPYMPMHKIGISFELPWKTGSLMLNGTFESSRFTETGNIAKLSPVFLLNVVYNQKLNENIGIFGKINNLTNTGYVSYKDYPMPGINFVTGLNINFSENKIL